MNSLRNIQIVPSAAKHICRATTAQNYCKQARSETHVINAVRLGQQLRYVVVQMTSTQM